MANNLWRATKHHRIVSPTSSFDTIVMSPTAPIHLTQQAPGLKSPLALKSKNEDLSTVEYYNRELHVASEPDIRRKSPSKRKDVAASSSLSVSHSQPAVIILDSPRIHIPC
jgi:hypothetical protein